MISRRSLLKVIGLAPAATAVPAMALDAKSDIPLSPIVPIANAMGLVVHDCGDGSYIATWDDHGRC